MRTIDRRATRAVIFDFDGVLADTEDLHFETFAAALAEEGIEVTREVSDAKFLGLDDRSGFALAFEDAGRLLSPADADRLVRRKAERYAEAAGRVPLLPGALEAIHALRDLVPFTVASCSRRSDIRAVMEANGIARDFPEFVSADDIERSKPHPECYLAALDLLHRRGHDLTAADCLVFEDTFRGVEAAKEAGMFCVALTTSYPAGKLVAADEVIPDLGHWRWDDVNSADGRGKNAKGNP